MSLTSKLDALRRVCAPVIAHELRANKARLLSLGEKTSLVHSASEFNSVSSSITKGLPQGSPFVIGGDDGN